MVFLSITFVLLCTAHCFDIGVLFCTMNPPVWSTEECSVTHKDVFLFLSQCAVKKERERCCFSEAHTVLFFCWCEPDQEKNWSKPWIVDVVYGACRKSDSLMLDQLVRALDSREEHFTSTLQQQRLWIIPLRSEYSEAHWFWNHWHIKASASDRFNSNVLYCVGAVCRQCSSIKGIVRWI